MSNQRDMGPVTAELSGCVVNPGGGLAAAGIHLGYDSADPYAVVMKVSLPGAKPVAWTFGRELLADGLSRTSGAGDVTVAPCPLTPSVLLHVILRDDVSEAVVALGIEPVREFLLLAHELVPPGSESSFLLVEDDASAIAT